MDAKQMIEKVMGGTSPEEAIQEGTSDISVPVGNLTLTNDPASAKAVMQLIKDSLAKARMPRISKYRGGEITGWTNSLGSTGFSVREEKPGLLDFHVVISGKKAGVRYRTEFDRHTGDEVSVPADPDKLLPKIKSVFKKLGLNVLKAAHTGHQLMWDDDIEYNVKVKVPVKPAKAALPPSNVVIGLFADGNPMNQDDVNYILDYMQTLDKKIRLGKSRRTLVVPVGSYERVLNRLFEMTPIIVKMTSRKKGVALREIPSPPVGVDLNYIGWEEYR